MRSVATRELIELEFASCIQKLAYLRGGNMTPRSFPESERAVIEAFGLACCRLMATEMTKDLGRGNGAFDPDGNFEPSPLDDDDTPDWRRRRKGE